MNDSARSITLPVPLSGISNPKQARPHLEQGFTLLELLVVLAIIGIIVGAAIFITAPSTSDKGAKIGSDTWDLMRSARTLSMMHRKIYGLELQQGGGEEESNEASLSLLVWQSEDPDAPLADRDALIDEDDDLNESLDEDNSIDGGDLPEYDPDDPLSDPSDATEEDKPDYAEHKDRAINLGLIEWEESMEWVLKDEQSVIVLPEDIRLDFTREVSAGDSFSGFGSSFDDSSAAPQTSGTDDLEEIDEDEYSPIVLFFPDGKISNAGRFNFLTSGGEVVFRFSWNELGEFERIN